MFKKISIISFAVFLMSGSLETLPIIDNIDITFFSLLLPSLFVFTHLFRYTMFPKKWVVFLAFLLTLFVLFIFNLYINTFDATKVMRFIMVAAVCFIPPFYLFRSKSDVFYFFNTLLAISFIMALVSLTNYGSVLNTGRLNINESNPIWLARAVSIGILWSVLLIAHGKIRVSAFLILFVPMMISLLLTGSKAPLIALIIAVALINFKRFKKLKITYQRMTLLAFSPIIIVPAIIFFWQSLPEATQMRLSLSSFEDSAREQLYSISVNLITSNFWGVGFGNFGEYALHPYPHNFILESFVELGWLFGATLIVITVIAFITLFKMRRYSLAHKAIFGLFIIAFVNAMFSGDLTSPKELYITIAIAFFASYTLKEEERI